MALESEGAAMAGFSPGPERRQFGRRMICVHGAILAPRRAAVPITVRNISERGAFLEGHLPMLPQHFRLIVEAFRLDIECLIKRQVAGGVGVEFVDEIVLPAAMPRRIDPLPGQ